MPNSTSQTVGTDGRGQHLLPSQQSGAERNAAAIAITAPERQPLSYGRLLRQVEDTVAALRFAGLKPNDRVALVLPNGPEMAVAFLGLPRAQPVRPSIPRTPRRNSTSISPISMRKRCIVPGMSSPAREVARKRRIPLIELMPAARGGRAFTRKRGRSTRHDARPQISREPSDTALVLHTSGTTSRPKIVPLTHANLCAPPPISPPRSGSRPGPLPERHAALPYSWS